MHPLVLIGILCIAKGVQEMLSFNDEELKWAHDDNDRLRKRVTELEPEPELEPPMRVVVVKGEENA